MLKKLSGLVKEASEEISQTESKKELDEIRIKYVGRKQGLITKLTKQIPSLPARERGGLGTKVKEAVSRLENLLEERAREFQSPTKSGVTDFSTPGEKVKSGNLHPLSLVFKEVAEIFHYLGFSWVDGPEIEKDEYNFQKLNIPKEHPARDLQQTYYLKEDIVLRTHTSNIQVRYMEKHQPPIRIISPGRTFRRDPTDATHYPTFHQIEGLLVNQNTNLGELIGTLEFFVKNFFGENIKTRVYGHYFPYTEPSIELEAQFGGKGWVELLGAGMVHPQVLKNGGIDPKKYQGWAFGMGADRLAMLKYNIPDLRLLFSGDSRFLEQF